jgi:hypothetical protein
LVGVSVGVLVKVGVSVGVLVGVGVSVLVGVGVGVGVGHGIQFDEYTSPILVPLGIHTPIG